MSKSRNPKGRTEGRRNVKTELAEIVNKKFKVREGETEHKLSLLGANVLAHGVKGAKGDVRSANLFFNSAHKLGLLEDEEASSAEGSVRAVSTGAFRLAQPPEQSPRPSTASLSNSISIFSRRRSRSNCPG